MKLRKTVLLALLLLAGCRLPEEDAAMLKTDAYLETVPADKRAVVRPTAENLSENSLEYKQFCRKLTAVLQSKGYDTNADTPAVIINLDFGVKNTNTLHVKYGFNTPEKPHSYDEVSGSLASVYTRRKLYSKFVKLTAVDAARPKVEVVKEDAAEDFRSAQNELLYLLSKYIEADSSEQIKGTVLDTELYQRFVLKLSAGETDLSLNAGMEQKRAYEKRLRERLKTENAQFVRCGLNRKTTAVLDVSSFGFLTEIEFNPSIADTRVRSCVADLVESFLPPPVGVPNGERFSVTVGAAD
mgnify:FL=1